MTLSPKLALRQSQSLVMTPQLLQAIKLLQFSTQELNAYIEQELERNPLLELAEDAERTAVGAESLNSGDPGASAPAQDFAQSGGWDAGSRSNSQGEERNFDDGASGSFDEEQMPATGQYGAAAEGFSLSPGPWPGRGDGAEREPFNLEAFAAAPTSLKDHLEWQLALAAISAADRMMGQVLIDSIDENGYFSASLEEIAARLGARLEDAERVLSLIQEFDPSGVGARNLAECLAIQLRQRDRYDPAMQALVAHLGLLAKRDFMALRKICGVEEEDLLDMAGEIKRLDPKPGRSFGGGPIEPVLPDVIVRPGPDGSWHVELNAENLPRLLVNDSYAARVTKGKSREADRVFISSCRQSANWLTKSLEQRARTILKVSSEIVRQQEKFFSHGVECLRPLDLKTVAEAVGVHESTVSRVTSNKYVATPRGLFELKYFFTASIAAQDGGEAHSAESVRFRIKQMIDHESPAAILSDDAIVLKLVEANIHIARRTVAKYRESLRIPSSVERRRLKSRG